MLRVVVSFVAMALTASAARAEPPDDGLYQRLERDFVLDLALGGGARLQDDDALGVLEGSVRLRYLDAAGLVLAVGWGSGRGEAGTQPAPARTSEILVGAELRPLFPALFLLDRWAGRAWPELLLQSFFVELGALVAPFPEVRRRGVGLAVGLGLDVPLSPPRGYGPRWRGAFLKLLARRTIADERFRAGPAPGLSAWTVLAQLSFRFGFGSGLSGWEPRRYR